MKSKDIEYDWELNFEKAGKIIMKKCTYSTAIELAESYGLFFTIKSINTLNIGRTENVITERKRIV